MADPIPIPVNSSWLREYDAERSNVRSCRFARRSRELVLLLLEADGEERWSALMLFPVRAAPGPGPEPAPPRGRRGKRKSCSVGVGFMEVAGLRVAMDDVVLASIVAA